MKQKSGERCMKSASTRAGTMWLRKEKPQSLTRADHAARA